MLHYILLVSIVVVCAIALVVVIGCLLPRKHTASCSRTISGSLEALWVTVSDIAHYARWRPSIHAVLRMPDRNGHEVWKENDGKGRGITYETICSQGPHLLVRSIADPELPFSGTWNIHLVDQGRQTVVSIREDGEVKNPVFRFVARLIIGHTRSIKEYLNDLEASSKTIPDASRKSSKV